VAAWCWLSAGGTHDGRSQPWLKCSDRFDPDQFRLEIKPKMAPTFYFYDGASHSLPPRSLLNTSAWATLGSTALLSVRLTTFAANDQQIDRFDAQKLSPEELTEVRMRCTLHSELPGRPPWFKWLRGGQALALRGIRPIDSWVPQPFGERLPESWMLEPAQSVRPF
jgi:hypothetical protein